MDPFNEVKEDAWASIRGLEEILYEKSTKIHENNPGLEDDYNNNHQELEEIIEDLQQAITISEQLPDKFQLTSEEIANRKQILSQLQSKISDIDSQWQSVISGRKLRDVTTMSNRISQDSIAENPFNESVTHYQEQEVMQQQDVQLDSIHDTMRSLNQQAMMMGNELEEHAYILDELDSEIDNVDNKLSRGLKRIGIFIEKNSETHSDWCIGILVVALCILLILVIAI